MIPLPRAELKDGGVPVAFGERFVQWLRYWRPLEITADDASGYRHPFEIQPHYDPGDDRWEIQLFRDSYVSAREVEAPAMEWGYLPRETRYRFEDENPGEPVIAYLSEEPWLPVENWRRVGYDADPLREAEVIPDFFLERGAAYPDAVSFEGGSFSTVLNGSVTDRARRRLLRCVDVVLNVERPRVRLVSDDDGRISVTLDTETRERPWITIQRTRYEPSAEPGSVQELIATTLGDDGIDRRLVGRVYLLSAPGLAPGSEVSREWTAYVDQRLFWNPQHEITRDLNVFDDLELGTIPALAGGVGQALVDGYLQEIEQNDALASAFVSQAQVTGRFWT